ncbi:uncharacterized protein LOC104584850 [Brachypodium distachyon]|uniref:DUF4220 domain-containing protein n=1 Tax=Brachypodium distachyon TaxID=15368 RepID=I1IHR0_BRADI|nr:uncharacterized protein LOC104584850 [Brachypodium distachyon]KQJ86421.1 hypothetical protein BRADI_4g05380v3 [Brachypodium distachyon]|eukprot:XP_010238913.1 uncharacterized protein LOC104584850 [Brachypodium distachyon]
MEQKFSVRNATDAATAWAATPVGILVRVEVLVTVSCTLLATLVFFGSGRRTSRSGAFRFVVWLVLMLCYPAVSYTIGLIQSGSFRNDLVVVWACFLLGCADGIFSCSVDDSDQQSRAVLNQATQVIYVLLLLLSYVGSLPLQLKVLLLLLWVLNLAKLGMRLWSLLTARRDRVLTADNWLISNYMAHDHVRSVSDFDPETMRGYRYVVAGHKDVEEGCAEYKLELTDDLVTVERLWQHGDGGLLVSNKASSSSSSSSSKLKDLCLSFALFKLLRRRLGGSNSPMIHERDDIRTLVFARNGLAGGDDHERMFRVIETELGFLFDFFYARYPSPKQSLLPETVIFVASMALSLSTFFSPAMLRYRNPDHPGLSSTRFVATGIDIWLARFVIALFLVLELYQYLSLVLSDWHKVKMLCRYVCKPSWQGHPIMERLLWLMCRATLTTRYWSHSVGQYSLLHGCLRSNRSCVLARVPLHKWIKGVLTGMKTVSRKTLPVTVKRAIHRLLRSEWLSNLRYGDRTLQRYGMLQSFDWSTSTYTYGAVGSILVWHVATAICGARQPDDAAAGSHEVATTVSDYCAYLLYQAPELVTDKIYDARLLMGALQNKIQGFLALKDDGKQGCRSGEDMFHELSRLHSGDAELDGGGGYEKDILADGIRLGYQIFDEMPDEAVRWNMLSEMWVELLLSVAPSDNVSAHIKKLATGGELVTQLWALLTHGGMIAKPDKPEYTS